MQRDVEKMGKNFAAKINTIQLEDGKFEMEANIFENEQDELAIEIVLFLDDTNVGQDSTNVENDGRVPIEEDDEEEWECDTAGILIS